MNAQVEAQAPESPMERQGIKYYVLDTNVLLHDPMALFKFKDNNVIIPIVVIEEVDKFKKDLSELGRNARQCSRNLDKLRGKGSLSAGVPLPEQGYLRVDIPEDDSNFAGLDNRTNDNKLLKVAALLSRRYPDVPVILVSRDTNVRIKADALGLQAVDYEDSAVSLDELYIGHREIVCSSEAIDTLYAAGELATSALAADMTEPHPNEYLLCRNQDKANSSVLARYHADKKMVMPIRKHREGLWGLQPRNKEQVFAVDLLTDDDIKLVTLVGKAGTGKTLLAIAAGLHKTAEESRYTRLVVSRPIFPLGRDLGFLPGDVDDKLTPWMKPIFDNVEYLFDLRREGVSSRKGGTRGYQELIDQGLLEIEPLTYIRGRSIPNQYLVIDEAQNLTPHEIKTIITRAGEGTKVVITGDPYQIDNPYIDSTNNGLTYVVERFKLQNIAGHMTLAKGERSELAELAANLL